MINFLAWLDKILRKRVVLREPRQMADKILYHAATTIAQEKTVSRQAAELRRLQADLKSYRGS